MYYHDGRIVSYRADARAGGASMAGQHAGHGAWGMAWPGARRGAPAAASTVDEIEGYARNALCAADLRSEQSVGAQKGTRVAPMHGGAGPGAAHLAAAAAVGLGAWAVCSCRKMTASEDTTADQDCDTSRDATASLASRATCTNTDHPTLSINSNLLNQCISELDAAGCRTLIPDSVGANRDAYDCARAVWNGDIDRQPGLIAQPSSAVQVAAVVRLCAENRLELTVRGGGHNVAGFAVKDGAVMLDLQRLDNIKLLSASRDSSPAAGPETQNRQRWHVRVGAGCTWAQVDAVTATVGGAVPAGLISHTGEGCYFLVFVQLFEKYGTLIERNAALIEKVPPCRCRWADTWWRRGLASPAIRTNV
eukprot:SAG31_NODE_3778_length_3890_cov_1.473226_2_plen_364_part_00